MLVSLEVEVVVVWMKEDCQIIVLIKQRLAGDKRVPGKINTWQRPILETIISANIYVDRSIPIPILFYFYF